MLLWMLEINYMQMLSQQLYKRGRVMKDLCQVKNVNVCSMRNI